MAKQAPDATIDGELDYIAGSDTMCVCSAEPTTEAEAYTTYMLARVAMAGGGNDCHGCDQQPGTHFWLSAI